MVYASPSFAGGLLELIAHSSVPRRPPQNHVASLIELPDEAGVASLEPPYPEGWDHPDNFNVARQLTRRWLEDRPDLCLLVPSVPGAPVEQNLVINARHPRFGEIEIIETVVPAYDPRVWG